MTTITRRKRTSRLSIGPYRRHELLTGRIQYPVQGYTGYGDGISNNVADFIGPVMRADWAANREELVAFWKSGQSPNIFPDCLPWLYTHRSADTLPWAATHLD
jgi:hypothetical protein